MTDDVAHWNGSHRRDGARIQRSGDDETTFLARRADGLIIRRCPCCRALLGSERAAQLVANWVWPLAAEESAA